MKSQPDFEWGQISADLGEVIPALRGLRLEQIATPLGGLSNSNYRLDLPEGSLVLRVPRSNPGPFRIDRQEEVNAARFAGKVGIGPPVLYANPQGVMLTRFVKEAKPMSIEAYRSDPGAVQSMTHVSPVSIGRICVSSDASTFSGLSTTTRLSASGNPMTCQCYPPDWRQRWKRREHR